MSGAVDTHLPITMDHSDMVKREGSVFRATTPTHIIGAVGAYSLVEVSAPELLIDGDVGEGAILATTGKLKVNGTIGKGAQLLCASFEHEGQTQSEVPVIYNSHDFLKAVEAAQARQKEYKTKTKEFVCREDEPTPEGYIGPIF